MADEPLPDGHVPWTMGNVIIPPRVASESDAPSARCLLPVAESLRRRAAGERLLDVVEIQRGE